MIQTQFHSVCIYVVVILGIMCILTIKLLIAKIKLYLTIAVIVVVLHTRLKFALWLYPYSEVNIPLCCDVLRSTNFL